MESGGRAEVGMLIVDGHNLIGCSPDLTLREEERDREEVIRRLAARKASGGEKVVVVFDGNRAGLGSGPRIGAVQVVFSTGGQKADDEILRRVRRSPSLQCTVVTSDRELAEQVRGLGAQVESSEVFWERIRHRRRRAPTLEDKPEPSPEEVDEWLRAFKDKSRQG